VAASGEHQTVTLLLLVPTSESPRFAPLAQVSFTGSRVLYSLGVWAQG